jgi:hypothetical protein
MRSTITSHILMIRPANFGFNPETAADNAFQQDDGSLGPAQIVAAAQQEFDLFAQRLQSAGVDVIVIEDTPEPVKTDAVFPNNWVTFHEDGTLITYPMATHSRRLERREEVVALMMRQYGFRKRIKLEAFENETQFLEGTGSLILDREHKLAYACKSPRTHEQPLADFCQQMNYEAILFDAVDGSGQAIYHTNVLMALGTSFVVICLDTVRDEGQRQALLDRFKHTRKEVIEISLAQMMAFAGNMLQVKSQNSEDTHLVMSEQAYQSLDSSQIKSIEKHTSILQAPIYVIEKYGGGSVRCMMAEVFI